MTPRSPRHPRPAAGLALAAVLAGGLLAACGPARSASPTASARLVAFASCDDLLRGLRPALRSAVGPYGLGYPVPLAAAEAAPRAATDSGALAVPGPAAPAFSGTNTRQAGVDEPDLVKTDGRRIVTVHAGVLRVADAASRRFTGSLDLNQATTPYGPAVSDLLLSGDHALLLERQGIAIPASGMLEGPITGPGGPVQPPQPDQIAGSRLLLVDLSGAPRLLGTYVSDGVLLDARMVGPIVRVVTRSAPRLRFPEPAGPMGGATGEASRAAANRAVVDAAGPADLLPRYRVTTGAASVTGRVGCGAVSRPASYSGASMITVSTFDLRRDGLGSGDPVTIVADADTVYATGASLYLAAAARVATGGPAGAMPRGPVVPATSTDIYRLDIGGAGRPVYRAAGSVPGLLINQYALDEWDGRLRAAVTRYGTASGGAPVQSGSDAAVYVLRERGKRLDIVGQVGGLGRGERIYGVRFAGPTAYVVTFRQTDPLYTVDLRDPTRPRVRGELGLTGYSAYLHPLAGDRLLGIGQEANTLGRVQGTQISLFDVSDPAAPRLLDRHQMPATWSLAEQDPHAFLYWPATGLLVVPVSGPGGTPDLRPDARVAVLRVGPGTLDDLGTIAQPGGAGEISRSLVVGHTLWTVSGTGLAANDLDTLAPVGWLPF